MINVKSCRRALVALSALLLAWSCVDEKYEISDENLDLEVTVFQEGLTIPIGSTDAIKLGDALSKLDSTALAYFNNEGGAYSIGLSDTMDLSESLESLSGMIEIAGVEFSESFGFSFEQVDVSDVKVDAIEYLYEKNLSELVSNPDITIPPVTPDPIEINAGIYEYLPDSEQLALGLEDVACETPFLNIPSGLQLNSSLINDVEVSLDELSTILGRNFKCADKFETDDANPIGIDVHIEMAEGVDNVSDVILNKNAALRVKIALENHVFTSGTITPHLDLDLHEIFHLSDAENNRHIESIDHIIDDFVLDASNGFAAENTYAIKSLVLEESDWSKVNGILTLDKTINVVPVGSLAQEGLKTTTRRFLAAEGNVTVSVTLSFENLEVEDVVMDINEIDVPNEQTNVAVSIPEISLPENITRIDGVKFTAASGVNMNISVSGVDAVEGLNLELEKIEMVFPEQFEIEGAQNNVYVIEAAQLSDATPIKEFIHINSVELGDPVNGVIPSVEEEIQVTAYVKASGNGLHTADLPSTPEQDVKLTVDVACDLELEDYNVEVSGFSQEVDVEPTYIKVELPETVKDMGTITIYPEGDPAIVIKVTLPDTQLDFAPMAGEGLQINFPDMLVFRDTPAEYDADAHALKFIDEIPAEVVLPIEKVIITPEIDPTDGKCYANGELTVNGGVGVNACVISKADVETLSAEGSKITFDMTMDELLPDKMNLELYETKIEQSIDLDLLSAEDIPEMLVEIGKVNLDEVYLNLNLDASQLMSVGDATLDLALDVALPSIIMVDNSRVKDGKLRIEGTLDKDGKFADKVQILGLNLEGVDLRSDESLASKIDIVGSVTVSDASFDVDELFGEEEMEMALNATIKNAETEQIEIASVTGKVDYKIEPVKQSIDLAGLADGLTADNLNLNLDINRFILMFQVKTNLGVPVLADLVLNPIYDGVVDESKVVKLESVELQAAESADKEAVTSLYISNKEDGCPTGYKYVNADLTSLLTNIPDAIELNITAGTDLSAECVFEPEAQYNLSAYYAVDIPLEFGENMALEFREVIPDIPEFVGTVLSAGGLGLTGEFTSSLPIELEVVLNLLDEAGEVIPLSDESGKLYVNPCNLDGTPVTTDLNVLFMKKEGVEIKNIDSIELVFKATAKKVAGVPLTENCHIQAALQAIIPEGVTVDLKDFLKEEGENK